MGLPKMSILELLRKNGEIEEELMRRGVMGKRGGMVGGYMESLVCLGLGLQAKSHNKKDIDAVGPDEKKRQIKGM